MTTPKQKPRAVYWLGEGRVCEYCKRGLVETLIDARVRDGGWMVLDADCHASIGMGFGVGRAQRYQRQADDRWLKVEG